MTSGHAKAVRYTAIGASAVWAIALQLSGVQLDSFIQKLLAYLPAAAALLTVAFDKQIWKWPPMQRLVGRPRIDGTWLTTIAPGPGSNIPEGGNRGPILGALVVEQTYWTISVRLLTEESSSMSEVATLRSREASSHQRLLTYTYRNEPKQEHRHRSPVHHGACEFTITGLLPQTLAGRYWTDRLTAGDMELTLLDRHTDRESVANLPNAT